MKKRFYSVSNMLFSSIIAMLGLGACKSQRTVDRPQVFGQPQIIYITDTIVTERKETKVVYAAPVVKRILIDWRNARPDAEGVYDAAEVMPQFPGGERERERWMIENLKYPEEARSQGITGSVMVSFNVNKSGKLDGVTVIKPVHPALDAEAVRLVKSMPRWMPGTQNGKVVTVRYFIPVEFR